MYKAMKKIYLAPTTDIINVHTQGLIMGSGDGEKVYKDEEDQVDPGQSMSRRNSNWDDEEEEDY